MKQREVIQVTGGASKDTAHQERVKVPSESGFRKQRQLYFFQSNVLSLLLAVRGLHCRAGFPLAAVRGAPLERRWAGFSLWWPLLALSEGSRVRGLQQSQLPGSGAPAQRLWGTASAAPCPAAPSPTRHRTRERLRGTASAAPCPAAPSPTRHRTRVSWAGRWFPYDGATGGVRDVNFICSVFPVSLSLKRGRKAAMGPSTHQSWNSSQDPAVPQCPLRAGQVLGPIPPAVRPSSVAQSCPTLCNPMDCGTPGLSFHQQLPEFTQTHVYPVSDAIQPSYPLSSPSPPAFNPSRHQGLFQ